MFNIIFNNSTSDFNWLTKSINVAISVLGKSIIVLSKMFSTSTTMLLFAENNALVILASSFNLYSILLLKDSN